jgi:hypothetical protein
MPNVAAGFAVDGFIRAKKLRSERSWVDPSLKVNVFLIHYKLLILVVAKFAGRPR